jgi:hypothetical protein
MRVRPKILSILVLAGSLATAATIVSARVSASSPPSPIDVGSFGMVGIASGQTARLNLVLSQPQVAGGQLPPGLPVRVQLSLVDAMGNPLLPSSCAPGADLCLGATAQSVSLVPGQSTFLDVTGDQVIDGSGRAEIRAVAKVYPPGPPVVPANLIATLEIIDNATKKTILLYPFDEHRR